jgi:hypothetical protein
MDSVFLPVQFAHVQNSRRLDPIGAGDFFPSTPNGQSMRMTRVSTGPLAHLDLLALFSQSGSMHTRITIFMEFNSYSFVVCKHACP